MCHNGVASIVFKSPSDSTEFQGLPPPPPPPRSNQDGGHTSSSASSSSLPASPSNQENPGSVRDGSHLLHLGQAPSLDNISLGLLWGFVAALGLPLCSECGLLLLQNTGSRARGLQQFRLLGSRAPP